jgi:CubicO group peptidase (beta-lactamase class C family)
MAVALRATAQEGASANDPVPGTLEEFQTGAAHILQEGGVPGAGIALVRRDAVEWEGGLGYADRDARVPVTADTHFRVGSISKTFIALALVQMFEDGLLDLDDAVAEAMPEIAIDNPWHATDPVRVIHLLQHTSGFDEMHFNEMYVADGQVERPLLEVLQRNPRARRVRWRPGTRTSYSNHGYAVAGLLIEKIAGEPYEDYIKREIFDPLAMTSSSFRLAAEDEGLLARGYAGVEGPAVGFPRIHLRPSGNMHSSPREMGRFVRMLLGWGELETAFVVDPEYLGNMEQPRTTLAAAAGLRTGYGTGIFTFLTLPYPMLGHDGGIEGFISSYAYSPSRDVGYVILLNSYGGRAQDVMVRLSSLALHFLKRDVELPSKPQVHVDAATLDQYVGYYHDANPRYQIAWPIQFLLSGRRIVRDGDALYAAPFVGGQQRLTPVSQTTFRLDTEIAASRVFTPDAAGTIVMAGPMLYAERQPRWRVELVRMPVLAAALAILSIFGVAVVWVARLYRARPRGFWELKVAMLCCPLALMAPAAALALTPSREWGIPNAGTYTVFGATLAVPVLACLVAVLAVTAWREGASRLLSGYALLIAAAMGGLGVYFNSHDLIGLRMWLY